MKLKDEHKNGTYSAVNPNKDTVENVAKFMIEHEIKNPVDPKDLHVTTAYSRKPIPEARNCYPKLPMKAKFKKWEVFNTVIGTTGKCLVAALESDELQAFFQKLRKDYGAEYDYPEYIPHMTLTYSFEGNKVPEAEPEFDFIFDGYTFKGIDTNWSSKK